MNGPDESNGSYLSNKSNQAGSSTARLAELKKATQGIEALFVKDLLSAMRRAIPKESLGASMAGGDIYRDMFDEALAESIGKSNALGIGQILYNQFSRQFRSAGLSPAETKRGQESRVVPQEAQTKSREIK